MQMTPADSPNISLNRQFMNMTQQANPYSILNNTSYHELGWNMQMWDEQAKAAGGLRSTRA